MLTQLLKGMEVWALGWAYKNYFQESTATIKTHMYSKYSYGTEIILHFLIY